MPKQKPTVYLDTNILSVLCYQGSNLKTIHQGMVSREWWDSERRWFRVYGSVFTESELSQGLYPGQDQALKLVQRLRFLPFTARVRECAQVYLDERVIPRERPGDAVQLAFAPIHRIDYLLTRNYAHSANLDTQRKLESVTRRRAWRPAFLVSPETIPRVALGQVIRRKDDENDE